ncbi:MAG: hypothetical protein IJT02_09645 [Synergistaceae bacterium]|nr:hypothetical protein [Synergistaceae bacterium]
MFYELIYTRCRNGIDILSGKPITSEGYKVYACSPELLAQSGFVDAELLLNAAQAKQSYADVYSDADSAKPFMDEAYLYCVPDFGQSFITEFHPVHYDPERVGNYTKKPGNFLNQIFAGDFGNFYAWELFGDSSVWNAKLNDEPYYYSVNPAPLPMRELVPSGKGYTLDDIREFIAGGRTELLKKAVSFLIAQYALKPEERRYLVIREACSRNIELWIAAIECAFSPRMSAGLPFATRLDNYPSSNVYTVRALDGKYQPMMNFQDPSQRMRFRAMIVGVNMQDNSNNGPVMAFAAKQFAVLDGVKMTAEFEADTGAGYFGAITGFDSEHREFCAGFLQALDIRHPSPDMPELYEAFCGLKNVDALTSRELSAVVGSLCSYGLADTPEARRIYSTLRDSFVRVAEQDFDAAVLLAEWVERNSRTMNDGTARENLSSAMCALVRENMFSGRHELLEHILSSSFGKDAAAVAVSAEALKKFVSSEIAPPEGLYFCKLFNKCARMTEHKITQDETRALVSRCISLCAEKRDKEAMSGLMDFLSGKDGNRARARDMVLTCAGGKGEFVVNFILDEEPAICASFAEAVKFCGLLDDKGLGDFAGKVLGRGIKSAKKTDELIRFAEEIRASVRLSEAEKTALFTSMDSDRFCRVFMSRKFSADEDSAYMYSLILSRTASRELLFDVVYELVSSVKKRPEDWLRFLAYSSKAHRDEAVNVVVDVLYEMSSPEKALSQLDKATPRKDRAASDMFADIEELATKELKRRPKKGLLGKLAGLFMRGEQES